MAPSPIPAPLPPWARALLQVAPLIQVGLQFVLDHIGTIEAADQPNPAQWRRVQTIWGDPTDLEKADKAVTSFDIVNITGGAVDSTWNDADYTTVYNNLLALCQSWLGNVPTNVSLQEMRFYVMAFNPLTDPEPFAKSGAPERIYTPNFFGTAGPTQLPGQVAVTSTDRTPYPKHWGRNYWPFPATTTVAAKGYIGTPVVDALSAELQSIYGQLMTNEFFPVVAVTQIDKAPARGLLTLSAVQVDNVFDVQRRRRAKQTTHRVTIPAAA